MSRERVEKPFIIAGPCSVETRGQTLATCRALARYPEVDMIRGGVWKPRTFPSSFQGVGKQGLEWLAEAKGETGLPFGVEVATASHVEDAVRAGADMVWLGTRTTGNPFSVQEIADALRGTDMKVLVKNGQMPDTGVWTGAVERLLGAVALPESVILVHRGFSQTSARFRNPPLWHVALEMRRRFPFLRMLCDPSHIGGNRELISEIAQKAADLSYDGLFIESHIDPAVALSDAGQQVTPARLHEILSQLKWRREDAASVPAFEKRMESLRFEIDQIDSQLFSLLSHRMKIADEIGRLKRENDVTIFQRRRWEELVENIVGRAEGLGLSPEFIRAVLDAVHMESIAHQNRVMNGGSAPDNISSSER